jgi:two-component system response regulator TtrR
MTTAVAPTEAERLAMHEAAAVAAAEELRSLTPRERDVLVLTAKGLRRHEIAQSLCVTLSTVNEHRSNITLRLQMRTIEAVVLATRAGWV